MIIRMRVFALVFALAAPTFEQDTQASKPMSPCPSVFTYEPPGPDTEPGRWYGVISLTTDIALHSLLLNIVLDSKADIIGNWIGDVSTQNNMDFNIESPDFNITTGPATSVRIFVKFNPLDKAPRVKVIKLNGKEICNIDRPRPNIENDVELRALKVESTTKSKRWDDIWPGDEPKTQVAQARLSHGDLERIDYSQTPFTSSPGMSNNEVIWKKLNPIVKSSPQRTTSPPTKAAPIPSKLEPVEPVYDDYDESCEDTSKDYFDGRLLIRPII